MSENSINFRMPSFIDREFEEKVLAYIQGDIANPLKSYAKCFGPIVIERIEIIFQQWLAQMIREAGAGAFSTTIGVSEMASQGVHYGGNLKENEVLAVCLGKNNLCLNETALNLIQNRFASILQIECGRVQVLKVVGERSQVAVMSTFGEVFSPGSLFRFQVYWRPGNQYIYPNLKKPEEEPPLNNAVHYLNAERGKGDLKIRSKEGREFSFHQIYLDLFSESAKQALSGGFREASERVIHLENFSSHAIEQMRKFVYGQIAKIPPMNMDELLELLSLSRYMMMKETLFLYVIDWIRLHIIKFPLNKKEVSELLDAAFTYEEEKEFLLPCLRAAEKLEKENGLEGESSIDWSRFTEEQCQYEQLQSVAVQDSLVFVLSRLTEALEKKSVLAESLVESDTNGSGEV